MSQPEHDFTLKIQEVLAKFFGSQKDEIFEKSPLLQYLNLKTRSANRGSKSRSSFANHYAIYVLVEDYLKGGFDKNKDYKDYEGAKFTDLFRRQRELPFGTKLQNHALNHRLNEEFKKFFPTSEHLPIIRDVKTNHYWINENLLIVKFGARQFNIAAAIKEIIDEYIQSKRSAFEEFVAYCKQIINLKQKDQKSAVDFIRSLLKPNVDARIFEIVSYAILKEDYSDQRIYWGWSMEELNDDTLKLYKTGRTNANDGGIDFVMKPLGRFFQVTETIDAGKYFLDIDKVQRFPITFVVKSELPIDQILSKVKKQAEAKYQIKKIVGLFMECVEEVINLPILLERFEKVLKKGRSSRVVEEIILQSKLEFNVSDDEEGDEEETNE